MVIGTRPKTLTCMPHQSTKIASWTQEEIDHYDLKTENLLITHGVQHLNEGKAKAQD